MLRSKFFQTLAVALLVLFVAGPMSADAQKKSKKQHEQPTTGGVAGRVRVDSGRSAAGVSVQLRRGEEDVAQATTNAKGEFEFRGVEPGTYGLTLRKPGLQIGRMESLEVRAGQTVSLKDHLYLPIDEGSIAFIKGSVFDAGGRSFPGARVELARVEPDGSLKKLGDQISNITGSFVFRLPPEGARYRVTAKAGGMEAATQEVTIEGAAIYRTALSLKRAPK
ncbi:MAG TPA: carboxypeptidase-like regulatory domain-containing protein [Pyrinomonadaceae bacterium]|nr:carboxypeptidase-like regulatory domain-containing protein [Pyrinomonadaceae bacterium]